MIHVSDNAKKQISRIVEDDSLDPNAGIRVQVVTGGCSGLSYELKFDNETREGDKIFESNGAKIIIDNKSYFYIAGMTLDYSGGLNGKGFLFSNPNATKTCSCGISFAVKGLKPPEKTTCAS